MKFRSKNFASFAIAFVFTAVGFGAYSNFSSQQHSENQFLRMGFDFQQLEIQIADESAVRNDVTIPLSSLMDEEGVSLTPGDRRLYLLVIVDPSCRACRLSVDLFGEVRAAAAEVGIHYLPLFLSDRDNIRTDFSKQIGFEKSLMWNFDAPLPANLAEAVTPTHILLDSEGRVLLSWPGSNQDAHVRRSMGQQIAADIRVAARIARIINLP